MFEFLVEVQRSIYAALSEDIATFAEDRHWSTLFAMLPLGIVFGAAHAMTPGHSKAVLATYILWAPVLSPFGRFWPPSRFP
jgi:ABC-type nickel/cobalt efflux system permease component RcnA